MANHIAKIPVLEKLLKNRYHKVGKNKIEIGNFWSVLQIYHCIQWVGVSVTTLCKVASMIDGRLDSKYRPETNDIRPASIRNYLALKSSPTQVSHTVVTKTISRGVSRDLASEVKSVLVKNNTYGPDLLNEILKTVDARSGQLINTKANVMGNSGFAQVLKLSLALIEFRKMEYIPNMHEVDNAEHIDIILEAISAHPNIHIAADEVIGTGIL